MSKKKIELLKECAKIMQTPAVAKWYEENLEKKPQYETINSLQCGVESGKLTIREALSIALIVGVQWNEKFEGV
jgi:hypothetical protein